MKSFTARGSRAARSGLSDEEGWLEASDKEVVPTPCYLVIPADKERLRLRRYRFQTVEPQPSCPLPWGYHDKVGPPIGEVPAGRKWVEGTRHHQVIDYQPLPEISHDDSRWPTHCDCGYVFVETDHWQHFYDSVWKRTDTGKEVMLRDCPPGAIWDAWWLHGITDWMGPDGLSLMCKTPGGDWHIDGRASNCTLKDDHVHKCWIRHGVPPLLTVDKNGVTCAAGAGSILAGSYHGFLQNGVLT